MNTHLPQVLRAVAPTAMLLFLSTFFIVGCAVHNNLFVQRDKVQEFMTEVNGYASDGRTVVVRTYTNDRYTFANFSIDMLHVRGVLRATQLHKGNTMPYSAVDSILTIPRKDIYSIKVEKRGSVLLRGLGGMGIGMGVGYVTAFVGDMENHAETGKYASAGVYHGFALFLGVIGAYSSITDLTSNPHYYYYLCPNDDCEGSEELIDRANTLW